MRKIGTDELKKIQIEIADEIHAFCFANNLRYSLCSGTLLGAVRHKGYIPWDDDIDFMMPRKDYEAFIRLYKSEKNEIIDLRKVETRVEPFMKVSRRGTIMKDIVLGRSEWGVNVDIFPIDGAPDDYKQFLGDILKMRKKLAEICPYYKVVDSRRTLWHLKYILKRIVYFYPHSVMHLKEEIDRKARIYDIDTANYGGALLGGYRFREAMSAKVFREYCLYPFEGRAYFGIKDYETYLRSKFDDYLQLPPKEKQVTRHQYDSFIED